MPRGDGPFKVIAKINDNAYKLELPNEYGVSDTFNVTNLTPYLGDEDEPESRSTPSQEREYDEDITSLHQEDSTSMQGPMTHAHARRLGQKML
jgi:hypothetical protein